MPALKRSRNRIFLEEDVVKHTRAADCWVMRDGKVYDVTAFLNDHPGGDDLILQFAGKDVGTIMDDPMEHSHSDSAYDVLNEYQIGVIGAQETIVRSDFELTDDFVPEDTAADEDYKRNQFLDLSKPLLKQIWFSEWSKAFYLQQVHQPRHLPGSALLFGPAYLECFTLTPWYVVPIFWAPIAGTLLYKGCTGHLAELAYGTAVARTAGAFAFGLFMWTLIEYCFHRFLFHVDKLLPDTPAALTLHFLLHGVHHYLPMDRMRLVMPPPLFMALQFPVTQLTYRIFDTNFANSGIAGAFVGYIIYDVGHYAMHHTKLPQYLKAQKTWHMHHHYKMPNLGFGVSSPIWDYVFGTTYSY